MKYASLDKLLEAIRSKAGSLDAPFFIAALRESKIPLDCIEYEDGTYSIQLTITDEQKELLMAELAKVAKKAKSQREFTLEETDKEGVFSIPLNKFSRSLMFSLQNQPSVTYGILPEHVDADTLVNKDDRVLDVGAGAGQNSMQMVSTGATVFGIEPSEERDGDFTALKERLGEENVSNLTLQKAIEENPDKFIGQYDKVTMFKYNIPFAQKDVVLDAALECLTDTGELIITSVERGRGHEVEGMKSLYLISDLEKRFGSVVVEHVEKREGGYDVIRCSAPRLDYKAAVKKRASPSGG